MVAGEVQSAEVPSEHRARRRSHGTLAVEHTFFSALQVAPGGLIRIEPFLIQGRGRKASNDVGWHPPFDSAGPFDGCIALVSYPHYNTRRRRREEEAAEQSIDGSFFDTSSGAFDN